jgi:hypothetical protein
LYRVIWQPLNITAGFSGANSDATDPAGSFSMLAPPTVYDANLAWATFSFSDTKPQSSTVVLGDIQATVPASARSNYKGTDFLQLITLSVNTGKIAGTVSANGVHVNAYFGDVTGNGTIDGLDVATASNVAQGKDTGFAAYQLLDPAIVGDVALDYSVDAGDVSDLAAYTVHLPVPVIPPIPPLAAVTYTFNQDSSASGPGSSRPVISVSFVVQEHFDGLFSASDITQITFIDNGDGIFWQPGVTTVTFVGGQESLVNASYGAISGITSNGFPTSGYIEIMLKVDSVPLTYQVVFDNRATTMNGEQAQGVEDLIPSGGVDISFGHWTQTGYVP